MLLREPKAAHEGGARVIGGGARAEHLDHLVDVAERDLKALKEVGAALRLAELKAAAAEGDVAAVL